MNESVDELDRLIISALYFNPRASWGQIARALQTSEVTVARRAQRLFALDRVAVVGVVDHFAGEEALSMVARIACRPGSMERVAQSLAREAPVRFAALITGASACLVELVGANHEALLAILDSKVGAIEGVTSIDTQVILQTLSGTYQWTPETIPDDMKAELVAKHPQGKMLQPISEPVILTEQEQSIVEALRIDGRTSLVDIATKIGSSQSTAKRRIESLLERGILHFRLLVEPSLLGYGVEVMLWMQVPPAALTEIAEVLTRQPALRYLVATAGTTNLFGSAVLRTQTDMFNFSTEVLGQLSVATELQLVLKPIKRHWHLL